MVFTVYNAALFKSLPFDRPTQIVHIHWRNLKEGWERRAIRYEDFLEYRAQAKSFNGLAAYMGWDHTIRLNSGAIEHIDGYLVTPNTFSLIGQRPLLGRDFRPGDDRPDADPVIILSHAMWQSQYGSDPSIIGKPVRLDAESYRVVGVMPKGIEFPRAAKVWRPIVDTPQNRDSFDYASGFDVIGRLQDDVPPLQAQTELRGVAGRIAATHPGTLKGIEPVVLPYVEWEISPDDKFMGQLLLAAVSFVLLIACANVANLWLSRAVRRSREMAIRIALGASRWRLVRQLLVESLLLSLLGGIAGLGVAKLLVRRLVDAIQPLGIPYWVDWSMDVTSLMYLLTISVLAGILFGLAPALQISKTHVTQGLKETGHQASSGRRGRVMTNAIVAAEISLTLVLMVGAGLFVRSLMTLQSVDLGLRTSDLLTATVPLSEAKYPTVADRAAFVDRLTDRLATAPDLAAFTFASKIPAGGAARRRLMLADRNIADGDGRFPPVAVLEITPGYFQALGLTMPRGREFAATDGADGAEAAIVNPRFAAQYWPGEDPIGKKIQLGSGLWITVVGVSPTIRQTSLRGDVEAMAYVPFRQSSPFWFRLMCGRTWP